MNKTITQKLITISKKPKGIINQAQFSQRVRFELIEPSHFLKDIVEHYWLIAWDLPKNQPHIQKVMPHPAIHATFLEQGASVQGITKTIYQHTLSGKGNLIGVKFKPAGFYPFANKAKIPISSLTDQNQPITNFFDIDATSLTHKILSAKTNVGKIALVENKLFANFTNADANIKKINSMVKTIEENTCISNTTDLATIFAVEPRQVQRLFSKYIGIHPKWIINRYRIHQALDILENRTTFDWPQLALDLGYFDQAHFINDFKSLIGATPAQYIKQLKTNK